MKNIEYKCDIQDMEHKGDVRTKDVKVIFDHDQEDGLSKTKPYFDDAKIEMCEGCFDYMMITRRQIYAHGAMGYNKYYLTK